MRLQSESAHWNGKRQQKSSREVARSPEAHARTDRTGMRNDEAEGGGVCGGTCNAWPEKQKEREVGSRTLLRLNRESKKTPEGRDGIKSQSHLF